MVIIAKDSDDVARLLLTDSSGNLQINVNAPTTIYNGQKVVADAGTREALGADQAILSITIKAHKTNTGNIFVGNNTVSNANGFILPPGEVVSLDIDNVADIYIDSAVDGEGVSWIAVG